MLSPGESSTPLVLDRAGVIAVGCNIHDSMINYLYVSDAPWIARTGADGLATIRGVPAGGGYRVQTWQPRLRPGRAPSMDSTRKQRLIEGQDPRQRDNLLQLNLRYQF